MNGQTGPGSTLPALAEVSGPSRPSPTSGPATTLAARHARQRRRLTVMLVVSLGVHGFALSAWALLPQAPRRAVDLDAAVVKTRLVKLGKPRDEKLLPRLPTSTPPTPPDKKPAPKLDKSQPTKPEPTKPEPRQSAADILDKFRSDNSKKSLDDLIKNKIGEETDEGQEHGDREGTALDGEVAQSYFARVTARIQKAMEVSSVLTDDERVRLKAVLCMSIADNGVVSDVTVKTSGSPVFDADVTAAARRASPVPAPPPPARARAAAGVCFNFCPTSCR
ncbi:MAG: TonB C-terminal domain-containing protein [Deltaproteobacteria bacterium]|nr:TonB C-terminal domain-containing protein [Deltaproteobacteria bacterium]